MRRLIPRALYPGRDRVGEQNNSLEYPAQVPVFDGVDWWGIPSLLRAGLFLRRQRPDVVLLQWWTGAVLHSYVVLSVLARMLGSRIVIEFHEVQDTGEARIPLVGLYTRFGARAVVRLSAGALVHSEFDKNAVRRVYPLGDRPVQVVAHGPFDHHVLDGALAQPTERQTEPGVTRLLYFGTIRPYKGLEHLVEAFQSLEDDEARRFRLSIVGETWEGWDEPVRSARAGRHSERIDIVNRYVHDDEIARFFADSDVVVLPYLRSSASGPLHIAMAGGLPVVVSDVGGLRDAAEGYTGVTWVTPGDVPGLRSALLSLAATDRVLHQDPRSWADNVAALDAVLSG